MARGHRCGALGIKQIDRQTDRPHSREVSRRKHYTIVQPLAEPLSPGPLLIACICFGSLRMRVIELTAMWCL